jgi:hypothetical protein
MTDAENMLWLKLRRKQWKGHPFYRQKIIGKYIVDFYPVRNNAPLWFRVATTGISNGVYYPKANLLIELDGVAYDL